MKKMCVITHPQFGEIRSVIIKGEPMFVVKDLCEVLGIVNSRDAASRLDDDERGMSIVPTSSGAQEMNIVNESGLYNLIFQSRKPEAKQFRKWVTSEVLPAIRRQGFYIHPSAVLSNKDVKRLQRLMLENVGKFIIKEDVRKCCHKFGFSDSYVAAVICGNITNNLVMNDLQERALINQEKWCNAYSAQRMSEVLEKLTSKRIDQ